MHLRRLDQLGLLAEVAMISVIAHLAAGSLIRIHVVLVALGRRLDISVLCWMFPGHRRGRQIGVLPVRIHESSEVLLIDGRLLVRSLYLVLRELDAVGDGEELLVLVLRRHGPALLGGYP